ncbi:toll/interleukin-1 receptor domain-containing protein [Roseateles sp. UC29_93]|uniref:toll/interleukin-1 receptor domain-containing protein n=1 Tax=Roseateles sp. UC29_93 TaxID=3350177 RepID=UPI00366B9D28
MTQLDIWTNLMLYDVFICHASEDKDSFVRPLAEALRKERVEVWYDEFSLRLGDSIRQSIDRGLRQSRFGVVVLSPSFFEKSWTQYELDGLNERQLQGRDRTRRTLGQEAC